MSNSNFILLLTACIEPKQFKQNVKRNNAEIRLSDYKKALTLWLQHDDENITKIIFAENSGFDLSEIKQVFEKENKFNKAYEIIQFLAEKVPHKLHYGFSELELIDKVIENYTLLKDNDYIIKSTGRVYFPKISSLTKITVPKFEFIADSRNFSFLKWKQHYVLSNLFIVKVEWYKKKILNKRNLMSTVKLTHFETFLYYLLFNEIAKSNNILLRFPFNVNPVGVGAHWNVNYQSLSKKIASFLRGIMRFLFSSIWI